MDDGLSELQALRARVLDQAGRVARRLQLVMEDCPERRALLDLATRLRTLVKEIDLRPTSTDDEAYDEGDDAPAAWEGELSDDDWAIMDVERWIADHVVAYGEKVCGNPNCGLPKPLNSSGRCAACMKWRQRHDGAERPQRLIHREILRGWV